MNDINRAVILAAGKGTRLKSLTQNKPKALMPVVGEPAIYHVIRRLVAQGIHDIAINIHHHAQQIRDAVGNGSKFNANIYYSEELALLDSGGGVRTAMDLLPQDENVAVYNADIMSDINLNQLTQACPTNGCALALVDNPKHNKNGDFSLQDHQVSLQTPHVYTFSGVSVWDEGALKNYPANTPFSLIKPITDAIQNEMCTGLVQHGSWFDIGRPRDLIQANHFYLSEGL